MKNIRLLALALAGVFSLSQTRGATFYDVQNWVGSGANQAAFVVDWNDGKSSESLLWGYRWDGAATGIDMLQAVVNADPRLFAHLSPSGPYGISTFGLGYDLDSDGDFGVTPGLAFSAGGLSVGTPNDSRTATDAADHWQEGWYVGYWGYYVKGSAAEAWSEPAFGPSGRALANGNWDGYSFAFSYPGSAPSEPLAATVPEPSVFALLFVGGVFVTCARRRHS